MAYIECPKCGQRALSIATRCPRCGHAFPTQFIQHPVSEPRLRRPWPVLMVAGALVALVAMVVGVRHLAGPGPAAVPPVAAPLDTATSTPSQPDPDTLASAGDTSRPAVPLAAAEPPPVGQQFKQYATTWVNVRGRRGIGAPAVRVLSPGEAVLVDSLRGGWYRVLVDGLKVGYVHRLYLDAVPPHARP
jgi:Bacterial SH3 domain